MIEETMDVNDNSSAGFFITYTNQRVIEISTVSQHDVIDNVTVEDVPLLKQPEHMIIVYCVSYILVFVIGLIGNSFVIAVIYKDPSMRNVTNYFILNMSVADIIIAVFCVPFTLLGNIYSGEITIIKNVFYSQTNEHKVMFY
jgi:hypothetical protein